MSLDPDALQARRPTHDADRGDSVSVPMLQLDSQHEDEHDNPFQRRPQPPSHRQPSSHYNVMIPTVEHWPALFVQGVKATAVFATQKMRQFQEYQQDRRSSSQRYEGLPTSSKTSPSSSQRTTFTFASKRQLKESGGRTMLCSGRRLTRILLLLCIGILIPVWIFVVPHSIKPYGDRDVWIRYFDHEEPIKIPVPLGMKVHVADVKHVAVKQLSQGFSSQRLEEGRIILIQENQGKLNAGATWRNKDWGFRSSPDRPILMVDPKDYELYRFLNENLRCFSTGYYFNSQIEFKPPGGSWPKLVYTLRRILEEKQYPMRTEVPFEHIKYIRQGFNDPGKNQDWPDKKYYYSQKEERTNAWMPIATTGPGFNSTPDLAWWRESPVPNIPAEPYTNDNEQVYDEVHEADFL